MLSEQEEKEAWDRLSLQFVDSKYSGRAAFADFMLDWLPVEFPTTTQQRTEIRKRLVTRRLESQLAYLNERFLIDENGISKIRGTQATVLKRKTAHIREEALRQPVATRVTVIDVEWEYNRIFKEPIDKAMDNLLQKEFGKELAKKFAKKLVDKRKIAENDHDELQLAEIHCECIISRLIQDSQLVRSFEHLRTVDTFAAGGLVRWTLDHLELSKKPIPEPGTLSEKIFILEFHKEFSWRKKTGNLPEGSKKQVWEELLRTEQELGIVRKKLTPAQKNAHRKRLKTTYERTVAESK